MHTCWFIEPEMQATGIPWVSFNGRLLPSSEAVMNVMDRAILYGDAAYTTLKVQTGAAIFLDRHLARLSRHLNRLRFGAINWGFDLRRAILDLISANMVIDGLVRVTVSRGPSLTFPDLAAQAPIVFIFSAARSSPKSYLDTCTVDDARDSFRDVKSVNRMVALFAIREARLKGCDEALFCNNTSIIEATGNNIFSVIKGTLVSPDLATRGMAGIVREVLLENNLVRTTDIPRTPSCPLFLTNSLSGIVPINTVDGKAMPRDEGVLIELRRQLSIAENAEAVFP